MKFNKFHVDGYKSGLDEKQKGVWVSVANGVIEECLESGGDPGHCEGKAIRIANSKFKAFNPLLPANITDNFRKIIKKEKKKFQYNKATPPDPLDGHQHTAAYDENGDGGTDEAGDGMPHSHAIFSFRVQPFYGWSEENGQYVSVHPGSLAFAELGEAEMEIFRVGTHNGDEYSEKDLEEIASNFHALKGELRPKLKITHKESQKTLAGLASYGDVVDVYTKAGDDGLKHLFSRIAKIPKEVLDFIKNGRFTERSIELYPSFKLGVKDDSPVYRNVLKAVALLGHEMPAVTGMDPVMLEECLECQGTIRCVEDCDPKILNDEVPKEVILAFELTLQKLKTLKGVR